MQKLEFRANMLWGQDTNRQLRNLSMGWNRTGDIGFLADVFEFCRAYEVDDEYYTHELNREQIRKIAARILADTNKSLADRNAAELLFRRSTLFAAPHDFDCFMQYMEIDRPINESFWLPRRKILLPVSNSLMDLEKGIIEFLGLSAPPRTFKTTIALFFMAWQCGKRPHLPNLVTAYGDILTKAFYNRIGEIMTDNRTYKFAEIFPDSPIVYQNAADELYDLNKRHDFATITCRSIYGALTGAVEAKNILYSDDLVRDIDEAMSPDRLDALWERYTSNLTQRKKAGVRELQIGTRWSLNDPLGRLEELHGKNPKYRFLKMPALDENDNSNFMFEHGHAVPAKFFISQRDIYDKASFDAIYQQEPIEREGLVFLEDEFTTYQPISKDNLLPFGKVDKRFSAVDVAWGGGDYLSMPIIYVVDGEMYLVDCVFNGSTKEITRPIVVEKLKKHKIHHSRFEANNGGDEYADNVAVELRKQGFICRVTHKKAPTNIGKLSRILQFQDEIKKIRILPKEYRSDEYKEFLKCLFRFNQNGKNKNDDAPDSLAMVIDENIKTGVSEAVVLPRMYKIF